MSRRIVLLGPTAGGKSEIALHLAERLQRARHGEGDRDRGVEIVGADSRQVYQGLEIGTAAPTAADRRRVPHHLAAFLPPTETYSAGRYARDARAAIADVEERGALAVIVGGSGLYLRALLDGLFAGPGRDETVRAALAERLKADGLDALRAELERVDPEALARIARGDAVRVIRALEVYQLTGTPISALRRMRRNDPTPARRYGIRWSRAALAVRIQDRIAQQLRDGFLEEARALLRANLPPDSPGLHTLGYRELLHHLRGQGTLEEAVGVIALRTRQLAKRQETWFRRVADVRWFDLESPDQFPDVALAIERDWEGAGRDPIPPGDAP
jgi:tRNA dimethylallyltransferase